MAEVQRTDEIQGQIIHEYDGIEEADNRLPMWWLWTFYGAIIFSVVYWFYYHEYEVGPDSMGEYQAALAEASGEGGEVSAELLTALAEDPDAVASGRDVWEKNCVVCHEAKGQGKIGPNLTDAYWVHGGGAAEIHETIDKGVLTKGMPAWGTVLGARPVQEVTAFVLTLRNTKVAGKAPEGELYSEGGEDAPAE